MLQRLKTNDWVEIQLHANTSQAGDDIITGILFFLILPILNQSAYSICTLVFKSVQVFLTKMMRALFNGHLFA
jgi:hypothetical protein